MRFQKSVPLIHKTGLHLRPARRIMDAAGKFKCDIKLMYRGKTANAKSITDIILLAALPGAELLIVTEGTDAQEAMTTLEDVIVNSINRDEDI